MPTQTDPLRELVDLCELLRRETSDTGAVFLATQFELAPWSTGFLQIIAAIGSRFDQANELLHEVMPDPELRTEALSYLGQLRGAFTGPGLVHAWGSQFNGSLAPINTKTLRMLSPLVGAKYQIPKLSKQEADELLAEVNEVTSWLNDLRLRDHDFLREALIEGLTGFTFRLCHLRWVGWGYTLGGLRDVIGALLALEKLDQGPAETPEIQVILQRATGLVKSVFEKASTIKEGIEITRLLVEAYGALRLVASGGSMVAGLLTFLG